MKNIIISLFVAVVMMSCNQETALEKINRLEPQMLEETGRLNKEVCAELVDAYVLYAEQNQNDGKSPAYLMSAIDISFNLNSDKPQKTIDIANILIEKYPDFEMTPMAMYIKGFVYENVAKDLQNAEKTYRQFLEIYPDSPLVESVKSTLENIGLSPEELIKKFEAQSTNKHE